MFVYFMVNVMDLSEGYLPWTWGVSGPFEVFFLLNNQLSIFLFRTLPYVYFQFLCFHYSFFILLFFLLLFF